MRSAALAFAVGAAAAVASPATADMYRFVDDNGVQHYTNVQPKGKRWKRIMRTERRRRAAAKRGPSRPGDRARFVRYDAYIQEAAALYQLPESFVRAVVRVESNFHPDVVSHAGAMGLMQLMPATATRMGVVDPFNPRQNIMGGARYLRILANNFNGDLVLTIAAYNAGQGAVLKYRGIPPYAETRRYVSNVLKYYYQFQAS